MVGLWGFLSAVAGGLITVGAGVLLGREAAVVSVALGLSLGVVIFAASDLGRRAWGGRPKLMVATLTLLCAVIGLAGGLLILSWRPSPAEAQLRVRLGSFIPRGESARNQFREELGRLLSGHVNNHIVDHRRRQIEMLREELGRLLTGQTVLRPEVHDHIMTEGGDRISESVKGIREVLNNWAGWKQ